MGGTHIFWKTKRIYKSCGLVQLISICTVDVLRQDRTGRNKGTCHTNSDNLSSFPGLGNSREELWVFHGYVLFDLRNTRSVLFSRPDFNEPCSILFSNSFHSKLDPLTDSCMWEKMPEDWVWSIEISKNEKNANVQYADTSSVEEGCKTSRAEDIFYSFTVKLCSGKEGPLLWINT